MFKAVLSLILVLAFALNAHAGQWTIEETDDNYIVEYKGDPAEKPASPAPAAPPAATQTAPNPELPHPKPPPKPGSQVTLAPVASPQVTPPPADPATQRTERVRDLSRRERTQRPIRPPGGDSTPE